MTEEPKACNCTATFVIHTNFVAVRHDQKTSLRPDYYLSAGDISILLGAGFRVAFHQAGTYVMNLVSFVLPSVLIEFRIIDYTFRIMKMTYLPRSTLGHFSGRTGQCLFETRINYDRKLHTAPHHFFIYEKLYHP
jgi:hypothetical protein